MAALIVAIAFGAGPSAARGQATGEAAGQLTGQAGGEGDPIATARAALHEQYAATLKTLAESLEGQSLAEPAAEVRGWLAPHSANTITLYVLPEQAPWSWPDAAKWLAEFRQVREARADALFALAREAVAAKRSSLAMELVLEAAHENPEHKEARRLLGYVYVPKTKQWRRRFAIQQSGAGKVWHDRFGWIPKAHVAQYEAGNRYYQNHWIHDDEDRRVHADIENGWRIESANYVITTNHSLEQGVALAERLERFHDFWECLFIGYLEKPEHLAARFAGKGLAPRDAQKHEVAYFRDRAAYIDYLKPHQPQIAITLGLYSDRQKRAYFFAGDEQQMQLIYHEATHQLFYEAVPSAKDVGGRNNVWIAEGIACYFESLRDRGPDRWTLGGLDAGRMPVARQRLLVDGVYLPLGELVTYGLDRLQSDPQIAKLYTESAGLATFLMHDDEGRYRPALVDYLKALYAGQTTDRTLAELTGADYSRLDRQYREFLSAP